MFVTTALAFSGCATIPNATECSAAGVMSAGADCAETVTGKQSSMTFQEYLDFLEPQPDRPDPTDPSKTLPARAGAMCRSAEDFNRQKTALETLCRLMGPRCTYEARQAIQNMNAFVARVHDRAKGFTR